MTHETINIVELIRADLRCRYATVAHVACPAGDAARCHDGVAVGIKAYIGLAGIAVNIGDIRRRPGQGE